MGKYNFEYLEDDAIDKYYEDGEWQVCALVEIAIQLRRIADKLEKIPKLENKSESQKSYKNDFN